MCAPRVCRIGRPASASARASAATRRVLARNTGQSRAKSQPGYRASPLRSSPRVRSSSITWSGAWPGVGRTSIGRSPRSSVACPAGQSAIPKNAATSSAPIPARDPDGRSANWPSPARWSPWPCEWLTIRRGRAPCRGPRPAMIPSTVGRSGKEIRVGRRPCVMQQHRVRAEQQVQERRLEVDAFALAEDQRVLVVGDNLDGRIGRLAAVSCAVDPSDGREVGREHRGRVSRRRRRAAGPNAR